MNFKAIVILSFCLLSSCNSDKFDFNIIQVSSSMRHSILLNSKNQVYIWGQDDFGQIGLQNNKDSLFHKIKKLTTLSLSPGEVVIDIATGTAQSFILTNKNRIFSWGSNGTRDYGMLGNNNSENNNFPKPIALNQLEDGEFFIEISSKYNHSLALTNKGKVFGWGWNEYFSLGGTEDLYKPTPTIIDFPTLEIDEKITKVYAGYENSFFITNFYNIYALGFNNYGQLGDGSKINRPIPTKIEFINLSSDDYIVHLSVGQTITSAISFKGYLYSWGDGENGKLLSLSEGSIVPVLSPFHTIYPDLLVKTGSVGSDHSVILTSNNILFSWGVNSYSETGNGTIYPVSTPYNVSLLLNNSEFVITVVASINYSMIFTNQRVIGFGRNNTAQLGTGSTEFMLTPGVILS